MIERLLLKLFKVREIPHPDGGPYLRRYYLTPKWFPFRNVFLHQLFTPDPDRALHDHPWDFWTFPLSGYIERRRWDDLDEIDIGSTLSNQWHYRAAEYTHRIIHLERTPTWTIMVTRKARREWGFWVEGRWIHWRQYLGLFDHEQSWEDVVR